MATNESAENYLETILILSKKLPVVRSVDIATELGFKKSSVSIAMKNLREKNHITVTDAGFIYLTDSGREIAEMIYERHQFLSEWLTRLGVPSEIANQDACKIEHVISKESFDAIKKHVIFYFTCFFHFIFVLFSFYFSRNTVKKNLGKILQPFVILQNPLKFDTFSCCYALFERVLPAFHFRYIIRRFYQEFLRISSRHHNFQKIRSVIY